MSLEETAGVAPEAAPAAPTPTETPAPSAIDAAKPEAMNEEQAQEANRAELRKVYEKNHPPEKARAEDGKFVGKPAEKAPEKPAEAKAPEKAAETPKTEAKPAAEPAKDSKEAPRAWAADMKAKWAAVPDDVKPYVAARETELHEAKSQIGRLEGIAKPIQAVFGKHQDYLKVAAPNQTMEFVDYILTAAHKIDTDPDAAFAELTERVKFKDPAAFIKSFAKTNGIDLGTVWDPSEQPPDPRVTALERENRELRQYQERQQQERAAEAERAKAAEFEQHQKLLNDFLADKPDVDSIQTELQAAVTALLTSHPAMDRRELLAKAYEQARWLNPSTRKAMQDAATAEQEKARVAAAEQAAAKARQAASVNVRSSPYSNEGESDEKAALRAIWRRNHG